MANLHSIVNISLPLCPSEGQAGDHSTCLTICEPWSKLLKGGYIGDYIGEYSRAY